MKYKEITIIEIVNFVVNNLNLRKKKKIKRACIKEIPRIIKHEFISEAIESIRVSVNSNSNSNSNSS